MQYGSNIVVDDPKFNKMNPEMVREVYATIFGEPAPFHVSTKALAIKVLKYYAEKIRKPIAERLGFNLAACEVCNSLTDNQLDVCPMCGDGGDIPSKGLVISKLSLTADDQKAVQALSLRTESDLDRMMAEVRMTIDDAVLSFYKVGELAQELLIRQLWRLRTDAMGNPAYRTAAEFAKAEFGKSLRYIYSASRVVRFLSLEQVRELGISESISNVATRERAELPEKQRKKNIFTVVFDEYDFVVPLRPQVEVIDNFGIRLEGGATSLAQSPSAQIKFPNGTHMSVSVFSDESGELQLRFQLQDKE